MYLQIKENTSFNIEMEKDKYPCHLGVTSSSIDDIDNDNFQALRINEDDDVHGSSTSLSNILDRTSSKE